MLLTIYIVPFKAMAQSDSVKDTYKKIFCDDSSYIEIENETFKEDVQVTCEKLSDTSDYGPVYNLSITKNGLPIFFTRKEILFHIPIKSLKSNVDDYSNLSLYFYDNYINDWVVFSSQINSNEIVGKVIHTGKISINEKQFSSSSDDIFTLIALIYLSVGIIAVLIYNKYNV